MTGPELFRESVSLAYDAPGCACETTCCIHEQVQLQRAQVLATLSLAAATALGTWTETGMPQPDRMDWWRAASGEPAERQRSREAEAAEVAEMMTEATS